MIDSAQHDEDRQLASEGLVAFSLILLLTAGSRAQAASMTKKGVTRTHLKANYLRPTLSPRMSCMRMRLTMKRYL